MTELNLDKDNKNNKNSYRYAGSKRKSRGNGGSTPEGNWRPDYLEYEEDWGTQESSASIFTGKYTSHTTWVAEGGGRGWEKKEL